MRLFLRLFAGCLVQLAPFALLCSYPFVDHLRFSRRKTALLTALLLLLLAAIFSGVSCAIDRQLPDDPFQFTAVNAVFFVCLLPCMVWYLYAVRVGWQTKLFIFMFALTSALAITSVQNSFWLDTETRYMPYEHPTLVSLTIVTAAALPALMLLLRVCYRPVANGLSRKEIGTLDVMSLLLFILLASILAPLDYEQLQSPTLRMLYFASLLSVFVIYAVVFRMLFHSHRRFAARQELTRTEHLLEISREQYKRITQNVEYAKRLKHDFHHHALALQGMLAQGDTAQARTYLSQYINALDAHELADVCESPILNTLIGYYAEQAAGAGVAFTAHVSIPKTTAVDDGDMAALMGNLMENAICAAAQANSGDRSVALNVIFSGTMLAITVDNGYAAPLRVSCGRYLSTKENHTGIGMESIEAIAEKYHGGVEFGHDATRFHASVMLNMSPPDGASAANA